MGKRGPAPKPTALKRLEGNPGKRPMNAAEARPAERRPNCPVWLDDVAKREWRRLARDLHEAGLLTFVDRDALAAYCASLAEYILADEYVRRHGRIFETKNGYRMPDPMVAIRNRALKDVLVWARELGLTPSARSSIHVETEGKDPTLADVLFSVIQEGE